MDEFIKINLDLRPSRSPIYHTQSLSTRANTSSFNAMLIDQQDIPGGIVALQEKSGNTKMLSRLLSFSVAGIKVRTKNKQVPIFLEHNLGDISNALGFVDNFSIEGKGNDLSLNGTFNLLNANKLQDGDATKMALVKMQELLSRGYNIPVSTTLKYTSDDTEVKLNEKLNEAYVFVKSCSLVEVSFVSSPACDNAMVKSNDGTSTSVYYLKSDTASEVKDDEKETEMASHDDDEDVEGDEAEELSEATAKKSDDDKEIKNAKKMKSEPGEETKKMSSNEMALRETNKALLARVLKVSEQNKILIKRGKSNAN